MKDHTRWLVTVENFRGHAWSAGIFATQAGARKRAEREAKRPSVVHVDVWTLRASERVRIKGGLRVIEGGKKP